MPHWDYRCPCCGRIEESSELIVVCEYCQQRHRAVVMERLPAAPNFVLKGPGFYQNDYKKKTT